MGFFAGNNAVFGETIFSAIPSKIEIKQPKIRQKQR